MTDSRRKGASFERELVRQLRDAVPGLDARRGLQPRGGREAPDVDCGPFWIEAKRGRRPNPRAALAQAVADAPPGRVPLAVVRDDRAPAFAVIRWEDLIPILAAWMGRDGGGDHG